jgi:hypothetical protein
MATRFHLPVDRRVPLPLTADDLSRLDQLKQSLVSRRALRVLSDEPVDDASASPSEAALLHALVEAGWRALEHGVEETGYAQVAAARGASAAERRGDARRRKPEWAAEQ